jgi:hypothetical protein
MLDYIPTLAGHRASITIYIRTEPKNLLLNDRNIAQSKSKKKKKVYSREISIQYSETEIISSILEVLISWHMVTNSSYILGK